MSDINLYAWCANVADAHRDYEAHELPLYDERDIALIEWTIRNLGNAARADARQVLAAIAKQHGLVLVDQDEHLKLREQVHAQKSVIDAAEAWAECCEDVSIESRPREDALYDAVEQYRLMDRAFAAARNEQPAVAE